MALAANALTTYSAVSGIVSGVVAGDQTAIERLINVYSESIERFCNRAFARTVVTSEAYARPNGPRLVLKRRPLVSIQAITIGGSALAATDYAIENAEAGIVFLDVSAGCNDAVASGSCALDTIAGSGELDVLASYTAGYILPQSEAVGPPAVVRTLPYDLEDVAIQCVASAWHRRGVDMAAGAFAQGGPDAPWIGGPIPGPCIPTLKRYQRWA